MYKYNTPKERLYDPRDRELVIVGAIALIRGNPIQAKEYFPHNSYLYDKLKVARYHCAAELAQETLELCGYYEPGLSAEAQERCSTAAAKVLLSTLGK